MREVTITSGRNMAHIDPHLTIWGWEIPVYLFLGGLVAGILFFSATLYLLGKEKEYPTIVRFTPILAPVLLGLGLFALFLDLEYKLHVFRFYTNLNLSSPMSWGSWTLAAIFPLSMVWVLIHWDAAVPKYPLPFPLLKKWVEYFRQYAKTIAGLLVFFAVLLGMYTGILLSAFNARPVWNSAILGPLFLVSGLSTGLALNLIFAKSSAEKHLLGKIDVIAIGVELFLIVHLFMGFLASTEIHIQAAGLFLGGAYTSQFWIFVVGIGLILPALMELFELNGKAASSKIPAYLVLFGGLMLRFIIVEAGQISGW